VGGGHVTSTKKGITPSARRRKRTNYVGERGCFYQGGGGRAEKRFHFSPTAGNLENEQIKEGWLLVWGGGGAMAQRERQKEILAEERKISHVHGKKKGTKDVIVQVHSIVPPAKQEQ